MLKRIALSMVCGLVLCLGAVQAARADAPPPVGSWHGEFSDGSGVSLFVGSNGVASYGVPGVQPAVGNWTWSSTSVGGILTIHYTSAGFANRLYYSITYVNPDTVILSDPYFRLTMHRQ